jgi:hypothetical protein
MSREANEFEIGTRRRRMLRKHKMTAQDSADRAFVWDAIGGLVSSGLAVVSITSEAHTELRLLSGELFILGEAGIKRV